MRKLVLWVGLFSLVASGAQAESYVQNDGTVTDPILTTGGAVHGYSGANLQPYANLNNANLSGADLTDADLGYANLSDANLSGANLSGADMGWVAAPDADLTNAVLTGAYLFEAFFTLANLTDADLTNAVMENALLTSANLSSADLSSASLTNAFLIRSNLTAANLTGANLTGAYIEPYDPSPPQFPVVSGTPYYDEFTDFTDATTLGGASFNPVTAGWTLVPEPSTALLLGIGLAGLGMRRTRRGC